jgi:hypothetical protein
VAQAVQAREDVLAIVSHDLRTPLAVVHTTTSMLLNPKYNLTPAQVREQLERIRRNVDQMNRMIGDLMDMVHMRSGQLSINPKPVVVNEVLREAVVVHEAPANDKGLELSYHAGTDVMRAEADRARLMQLFQNLIGNAVKFCKAGDTINVSSRTQGSSARIEIADSGPAFPRRPAAHLRSLLLGQPETPEGRHRPRPVHRQGHCRCARRPDPLRLRTRRRHHLQHHPAPLITSGAGRGFGVEPRPALVRFAWLVPQSRPEAPR